MTRDRSPKGSDPHLWDRWYHGLEHWWESGRQRWVLAPLAPLYGGAVTLRNWGYDRWLSSYRSSRPVVSIGNLSVGGSGKTPVVVAILDHFKDKKVAVLSRGYRREGKGLTLVDERSTPAEVGDEPFLIFQRDPESLVIVGDRVAGAKMAEQMGAELLLLDDGFQHRRLARDLDVVVDDGEGEHLFPWGRLREPRSSLRRADLIERPSIRVEPIDLAGKRVALFCGIARPERFVQTVAGLGAEIVETLILRDHEAPSRAQLKALARHGQLVCTEKDWCKLPPTDLPISCVRISHRLSQNLIDRIGSLF